MNEHHDSGTYCGRKQRGLANGVHSPDADVMWQLTPPFCNPEQAKNAPTGAGWSIMMEPGNNSQGVVDHAQSTVTGATP